MIEKLKTILSNFQGIDGYRIIENNIEADELFFIRKELDMNRVKNVRKYRVTVYKDFEEEGIKYRGSSAIKIHPGMEDDEILSAIQGAAFSAGFAKNKYYPLAVPSDTVNQTATSKASASDWLPVLTDAIFKADTHEKGWINSAELFLNKVQTRVINSEGVDVSYDSFKGEFEYITNWKEKSEEIELMGFVSFSQIMPEALTQKVEEILMMSRERANALPTPALKKHMIMLTGEPVKEFFNYYYLQSGAKAVYDNISTAKPGESIQGQDIKGDRLNIKLDPTVANSTESRPYDDDGHPLKTVEIFKNGILNQYWGSVQNSYYLGSKPTGTIDNIVIEGGSKSIDEMKSEAYLELAAFSHFQMNSMTGDFAGEIRLGWYYDGKTRIPVTGGSISGNIREVQENMYLSKELQQDNNFIGPKTIQLYNVAVVGLE